MPSDVLYVFRADRNYEGGDLVSESTEKPSAQALTNHVKSGSRTKKHPYISTTSNIAVMQKYMPGKTTDSFEDRARAYLITLPKRAPGEKYSDDSLYYDFSEEDEIKDYLGGNIFSTVKNYSAADSEITVSRKIPQDSIFEIQWILVDLLAKLENEFGYSNEVNSILEKIRDSSMSADKVTAFLNKLIDSKQLNNFETEFLRKYYIEGKQIDFESEVLPDKLFARQCIRTALLRKIAPLLLKEFNIEFKAEQLQLALKRGFLDARVNTNYTIEQGTGKRVINWPIGMSKTSDPSNLRMLRDYVYKMNGSERVLIPADMEYYCREDGTVDSWEAQGYEAEYGQKEIKVTPYLLIGDSHEGELKRNSPEEVRKRRAAYINSNKGNVRRYSIKGKGFVYYSFDKEGNCFELARTGDPDKPYTLRYEIKGEVRDEQGNLLVGVDPFGYGVDKLDIGGANEKGIVTSVFGKLDDREEAKNKIKEAEESYRAAKAEGKMVPEKSPLERTLSEMARFIIINYSICLTDDKKSLDESKLFGNLHRQMINPESKFEASDKDKERLSTYISIALEAAKEMGLDIRGIIDQVMAERKETILRKIPEMKNKVMKQEELIAEYKAVLERIKEKKKNSLSREEKGFLSDDKEFQEGKKKLDKFLDSRGGDER